MKLGAKEIILYGADYSYPEGKPYARGTYFFPIFEANANRLNPSIKQFYALPLFERQYYP